ncbi:G-type lectin S-receptor-like serine/threonine-protein kinase At1g34300 [Linum perenne]
MKINQNYPNKKIKYLTPFSLFLQSGVATFSIGFTQVGSNSFAGVNYFGGVSIWTTRVVDSDDALRFTSGGSLLLVNSSGSTVWNSGTTVTSTSITNFGDLVLRNRLGVVWSSFANLTDTIVPSQNFTVGQTLTSGVYSFSLLRSGNLTLTWNWSIIY